MLEGEAAEAAAHRGGHVQIIAAAGSGKTEVVSQRVASLLAEGVDPAAIVAFTFTEKAAEELKERIRLRVTALMGDGATDKLGRLFVGTIHAFCLRLLQTYVPLYETYTPLDANQLTNLLFREANRLGLKKFDEGGRLFRAVAAFQRSLDVLENELLDPDALPPDDFHVTVKQYYELLDGYRFMSFGTQIVRAVEALRDDSLVHARVTAEVRHLVVDEYQDVNPAQEQLIQLLAKPLGRADLVVVGDDDQAIYQWRGSNVANIVTFPDRYENVARFNLLKNRRSRPDVVDLANAFARTIAGRLPKEMGVHRPADGPAVSIAVGFDDEEAEADTVALDIETLHAQGVAYRDMAILVRGKVAYPKLLDALDVAGIPVQPGGRMGLFQQKEAAVLGATFAWISGVDWAPGRFVRREKIGLPDLLADYEVAFDLKDSEVDTLRDHLLAFKERANQDAHNVSLVREFYELSARLHMDRWDLSEARQRNRLGTVARFTNVLADYEGVTWRARRDPTDVGEQVGGRTGGEWFYRNCALILVNYATGNYDDFDGEDDLLGDGVALGTVHGAKGLEWPVVFLPSLTDGRFPSSRAGSPQRWLLPRNMFDAARYEGSDSEERRLFYVALTRARDWLALSSHQRVNTQSRRASPYILESQAYATGTGLPTGTVPAGLEAPDLAVTYSELAAYNMCPRSYLLRNELGFMPPLQQELGYGNAVHHLMRVIAEVARATGRVPTPRQINELLVTDFYLPYASKPAHKEMREKAKKLVFKYVNEYRQDLLRIWDVERPFELYLPGVVVSGRADVVYDEHDGVPANLAIVDYKTSTGGNIEPLQLQVYADAGRREGLTVGGAFVHDMGTTTRHSVPVDEATLAKAESVVVATAVSMRERDFTPLPEVAKCRSCDVRTVCSAAKLN